MKKFKLFNLLSLIFSWVGAAGFLIYSLVGLFVDKEMSYGTLITWVSSGLITIAAAVFAFLEIYASKGVNQITIKISNLKNKVINIIFGSLAGLIGLTFTVFGFMAIGGGNTYAVAWAVAVAGVIVIPLMIYQTILFAWRAKENKKPKQPEQKVAQ